MSDFDPLDQLRKLASLKDEGAIDETEFTQLKAALLARAADPYPRSASVAATGESAPPTIVRSGAPQANRISQSQVAECRERMEQLQSDYDQKAGAQQARIARLAASERRTRWGQFRLKARKRFAGVALGRLTPVMISTPIGALVGMIVFGFLPVPTSVVALAGILFAGASLIAALLVFVWPSDDLVSAQLASIHQEVVDLKSQIQQHAPSIADAQAKLLAARERYHELAAQLEGRQTAAIATDWQNLRGIGFENFLRDIFEGQGFTVRRSKAADDQGVDLILERGDRRVAVHAEATGATVDSRAIQQAYSGMAYYRCARCAVVTNNSFTYGANDLAERLGCVLVDASQIESLARGEIRL